MWKRSIDCLLALTLCACASTPTPPPAATAPAADVAGSASAEATGAAAAKSVSGAPQAVIATLTPAQQKLMDDAAQLILAGRKSEALAKYTDVQQQVPTHVSAWLNAALIKREQKQLPEAMALIDSALKNRPGDARALTLKGVVLREQGKVNDAKAAYLAAVQSDAAYAPAHRNLAVLADLYLDDPALALRHMEQYAALVGDDKQVNSWVSELRRRAQSKPAGASP